MTAALLGWGGFTWRKAEEALTQARIASDATDRLELKLAEEYVTKKDFETALDRVLNSIVRVERKIDTYFLNQSSNIDRIRGKLNMWTDEEDS